MVVKLKHFVKGRKINRKYNSIAGKLLVAPESLVKIYRLGFSSDNCHYVGILFPLLRGNQRTLIELSS